MQAAIGGAFISLTAWAIRGFLETTVDQTQRAFAYAWLSAGLLCFVLGPLAIMYTMSTGIYDPVRDDNLPQEAVPYTWARLATEVIVGVPLLFVAHRKVRQPLRWPGRRA